MDPEEDVREIAAYLLQDAVCRKEPLLAYNSFLESLLTLNGCQALLSQLDVGAEAT